MLRVSRPTEGAERAPYRAAILQADLLVGRDVTISISSETPTAQVRGRAAVSQRARAVVWAQMWPRSMAYRTGQREMVQVVAVGMTAPVGREVFQGIPGFTGWKRVNAKEMGGAEVDITKGYEELKNQTTRGMEKAVAMKASHGLWRLHGIPGLTGRNAPK